MYAKIKTLHKITASLVLGILLVVILPSTALAATDFSTSTLKVRNYGTVGSAIATFGTKGTGSPTTTKSSGEQNDVFQFVSLITNSDAGDPDTPTVSVNIPVGMTYMPNSLEYCDNFLGGTWATLADVGFTGAGVAYPVAIPVGGVFPGCVRFKATLNTAGTAGYSVILTVNGDGTDGIKMNTINSPMARVTGATDGDQKVVVTFGNDMSDTGLTTTTNYTLSTNGGSTYTVNPTGVVKDSSTQVTLTFAGGSFTAGNSLSLRTDGLVDNGSVQIENTATDGRYQTATFTATDTTPPSISSAVLFSGGAKLRVTFSESMTVGDITTANVDDKITVNNGHTLGGAGLSASWTSNTVLEITLGALGNVAESDTITIPNAEIVRDLIGNDNSTDVTKVVTLVAPVVSAPIATAQTLKSGDVSTSTVQSDSAGKIYMVKNGVAVSTKAEIDTAIAAKNAFLAKNGASADIAYTVTVPAVALINEGLYDIIAIDGTEHLSNRLGGWLTIDNTGPAVALTYSNNPTAQGNQVITATFAAAFTGTPKIAIDQPGTTDIAATNMTATVNPLIWTYTYVVHADDGATYQDGVTTVTISNVTDTIGNANQTATNNTFTINSTLPGVCGAANGSSYTSAPTSGLCTKGTASGVTSNGSDWIWACTWGTAVSCSADIASSGGGGGGGGGGGASVSTYDLPTSLNDKLIEMKDRPVQLPKSGIYKGIFTRETDIIHESESYGNISVLFSQGTEVTDTDGKLYSGIIYAPRFLPAANRPSNSAGLVPKGNVWLGRQEGNLSFSKNFTLTIPLAVEARGEAGQLSVFYYDETTQSYLNIGGTLTEDGTGIVVDYNKFGKFVVFANQSADLGSDGTVGTDITTAIADSITGFNDITNHWAKNYIQKLFQRGVISGKSVDKFDPDASLTRAELIKIALLNFSKTIEEDTALNFSDVGAGDWYLKYVNTARKIGIVAGYANGTFRPNSQVNRAEALKILIGAKGVDVSTYALGADDFYDVASDAWYAPYLAYAYQNGIIEGYKKTVGGGVKGLQVVTSDISGEPITALQDALFQLGFLSTPSNGIYDSATKVAVAKYQMSRGVISSYLDSDAGWFTSATLAKMQVESIAGEAREVRFFYPQNFITRAEAIKIAFTLSEL